ncbi:MAG TPA: hypothetical protein VNT25_05395 [Allosphingosinicella sp.]|nr:hypothetical protein [Allosphingosinicella sp.]
MPYKGFVEIATAEKIAGWAVDELGSACELKLVVNGEEVRSLRSDGPRPDLVRSGLSTGAGAFSADPQPHLSPGENRIEVKFPDGSNVRGTPFICTLSAGPEAETYKGHIDRQEGARVSGWAVGSSGGACTIGVEVNDVKRIEVRSDGARPDLVSLGMSSGAGGFDIDLSPFLRKGRNSVALRLPDGQVMGGGPLAIEWGAEPPAQERREPPPAPPPAKTVGVIPPPMEPPPAREAAEPLSDPTPSTAPSPPMIAAKGGTGAERRRGSKSAKARMPSLGELDELSLDDVSLAVAAGLVNVAPAASPTPEAEAPGPERPGTEDAAETGGAPKHRSGWLRRIFSREGRS